MRARISRLLRTSAVVFLLAAIAVGVWSLRTQSMRRIPHAESDPQGRVAEARRQRGGLVQAQFARAGVRYPAQEIFLRAFKREAELEVWARNGSEPFQLIKTCAITNSAGRPGPKRREGDGQVPEGFYEVDRFNPESDFRLSLGLNYPNASDRILSDPKAPGSDIFIHGGGVSIGCIPLGDDGIDELYLMTVDCRHRAHIPVHVFPARMSGPEWESFAQQHAADAVLVKFWAQLQPGYDAFERARQVPEITVGVEGSYFVRETR